MGHLIELQTKIMEMGMDGFSICGYTDINRNSGMTMLLCDRPNTSGIFQSGGSPASHEISLLNSNHRPDYSIDGILMTGRSVFGLALISEVYRYLRNINAGSRLDDNYIPIVPAAAIYDLDINGEIPDSEWIERAFKTIGKKIPVGPFWGGTGATVSKYSNGRRIRSGQGYYEISLNNVRVGVYVILNSLGDIYDLNGRNLTNKNIGSLNKLKEKIIEGTIWNEFTRDFKFNTTISAVITNAKISHSEANYIAEAANFGLASRIWPYSTSLDGDTVFCVSSCKYTEPVDKIAEMARMAAELAVLSIFF